MTVVHVIPVPYGYAPEDAWYEIKVFGELRQRWWQRLLPRTWAVFEEEA